MRCTEKQYRKIEGKIKHLYLSRLEEYDPEYPYLSNLYSGQENRIGFNDKWLMTKEKVFEEWNEKVFLEACGIETEKTFSLTADQLRSITDPQVKQWFPEVFEIVLEVGKWYKSPSYLICKQEGLNCFGFYLNGMSWIEGVSHDIGPHIAAGYVEATEAEVFEALKNEAVKRGFVEGVWFKGCEGAHKDKILKLEHIKFAAGFSKKNIGLYASNRSSWIFHSGKWAEIIPTKTKSEAEKELNCKIVD